MFKLKLQWRKMLCLVMVFILGSSLILGCGKKVETPADQEGKDQDRDTVAGFYRPEYEDLPEEIIQWIEFSKELPLVQEKQLAGDRYVLITEGMKPTGGYAVTVEKVEADQEKLTVQVQSVEPEPGEMVTEAITYPYDLIIVEEKQLPLTFVDVDDQDRYFMSLMGIDEVDRPIVASSQWIKVFTPAPEQSIQEVINLTGLANVFEGTVSYQLLTDTGELIAEGFAQAAMGDWGYYEEIIEIPSQFVGKNFYLELYSESMKDGSKMFTVTIPLSS